jgi:hypothetical protein
MTQAHITRRRLLQAVAAGTCLGAMPLSVRALESPDPKFLIVMTGTGGASIIDAMLAIKESESTNASAINVYPDGLITDIDGTPFRAIDRQLSSIGPLPYSGPTNQSGFVTRNAEDMMVVTHTGTSVNHLIAQKRAVTGNDAWGGKTLQELVAESYGQDFPIPNVNMGSGGFVEPGVNSSVPAWARGQIIANPAFFFAGLHGSVGIPKAPKKSLINLARDVRDQKLDVRSVFARTFGKSEAYKLWTGNRAKTADLEAKGLVGKLNLLSSSAGVPLDEFGFTSSPDLIRLRQVFPLMGTDILEAQAAMTFLLIKYRVSVSVTMGPNLAPLVGGSQIVDSPPLAYDFSHTAHRATQALMWSRLLSVADRLIGLLKAEEFGGGTSFWDHTLMYFATDFGRSKNRVDNAPDFGSGHHLNNGSLIVSPLANGNQVLGGVDPNTALTYGFDPMTGAADPSRNMNEPEVFAGILQSLGIDTGGLNLPLMPSMSRSG